MDDHVFRTRGGRLWRKGDLCHFSSISEINESWTVCAIKEEAKNTFSYPDFRSTDFWILLSVKVNNFDTDHSEEDIVVLHPNLGKLTVPIESSRIVLVCPAKLSQEKVGGNNE